MARKPYYKLIIGQKPYISADSHYPDGRIRIELSDALADRVKLIDLFDVKWEPALRKLLAFWSKPPRGVQVELTEPGARPLAAEVAMLDERKKEKPQ